MAYLHFDLKSANLLLGYRDRRAICKVADFGLSKQKRDTYVSNVTSQRGTLPWIAPEIIKTPESVTERVRGPHRRALRPGVSRRSPACFLCFAVALQGCTYPGACLSGGQGCSICHVWHVHGWDAEKFDTRGTRVRWQGVGLQQCCSQRQRLALTPRACALRRWTCTRSAWCCGSCGRGASPTRA